MRTVIQNGVVHTLCRQCDMHCGIKVHLAEGAIARITGDKDHPLNRGRICPKATAARELVTHPERLRHPLKRLPDGGFVKIEYEAAMDEIAARMTEIKRRHGARSAGVWTGEAIGFNQQADYARRFVHAFGSPNYFSAESVCFASRYIASCLVQGFYTQFPDFANANLILLWGVNPGVTHLPYMIAIEEAQEKGARLIVIDPRRSAAARKADLHVPIRPGTDGALAWGLARYLITTGNYDREFVERYATGFDRFKARALNFTAKVVAAETGVSPQTLSQIGRSMGRCRPRVVNAPGISLEHCVNGVDNLRTLACLSGLCGAVDRKGAEVWQMAPELGKLTLYDELPLQDKGPIGADRFPILYGMRKECHSISAIDRMMGKGAYRLRALVITGANPVLTNPNAAKVARGLSSLELLVVRDLFLTETAKKAHYILPAASFLERSELYAWPHLQRLALTTKVLDSPEVTDEYTFWHDLAHRLGWGKTYFPWADEKAVNRWLIQPTGISLEALESRPEGLAYGAQAYQKYTRRRLPTPSGKYEFASPSLAEAGHGEIPAYSAPPYMAAKSAEYPLVMITGARVALYYHSRYRNIARFRKALPAPEVEIHPDDARALMIQNGQKVRVVSSTGAIDITARIVSPDNILTGVVQISHGWEEANVNLLTDDADVDPIGGLPNMKSVRVRIEPP